MNERHPNLLIYFMRRIMANNTTYRTPSYIFVNDEDNLELAHLPLNGSPVIEGLALLPIETMPVEVKLADRGEVQSGVIIDYSNEFYLVKHVNTCALSWNRRICTLIGTSFTRTAPVQGQKVWEGIWA